MLGNFCWTDGATAQKRAIFILIICCTLVLGNADLDKMCSINAVCAAEKGTEMIVTLS
jgi:hypothetical protein